MIFFSRSFVRCWKERDKESERERRERERTNENTNWSVKKIVTPQIISHKRSSSPNEMKNAFNLNKWYRIETKCECECTIEAGRRGYKRAIKWNLVRKIGKKCEKQSPKWRIQIEFEIQFNLLRNIRMQEKFVLFFLSSAIVWLPFRSRIASYPWMWIILFFSIQFSVQLFSTLLLARLSLCVCLSACLPFHTLRARELFFVLLDRHDCSESNKYHSNENVLFFLYFLFVLQF